MGSLGSLLAMPFPVWVRVAPKSGLYHSLRLPPVQWEEIGAQFWIYGRLSRSVNHNICSSETAIHPCLYSGQRMKGQMYSLPLIACSKHDFFSLCVVQNTFFLSCILKILLKSTCLGSSCTNVFYFSFYLLYLYQPLAWMSLLFPATVSTLIVDEFCSEGKLITYIWYSILYWELGPPWGKYGSEKDDKWRCESRICMSDVWGDA